MVDVALTDWGMAHWQFEYVKATYFVPGQWRARSALDLSEHKVCSAFVAGLCHTHNLVYIHQFHVPYPSINILISYTQLHLANCAII